MSGTPAFDPYAADCPSRRLVDRIGDRWAVLVIGVLSEGPARNGELAARVGGISPKMLSQTLRGLERDGLITREAHGTVPPRVEYALTASGASLQPVLMGRSLRLHSFVVLVALAGGTAIGGILGTLLAVPITAVVWGIVQVWDGPGTPARFARRKRPETV